MSHFCGCCFNSLAPGRSECDSKNVIFNLVLLIGILRSSHDNALWRMPQDLTDNKSTLVQVMAWCRQTTSHYLSQCWLTSLLPYGVARAQWVNVQVQAIVASTSNYCIIKVNNWFADHIEKYFKTYDKNRDTGTECTSLFHTLLLSSW